MVVAVAWLCIAELRGREVYGKKDCGVGQIIAKHQEIQMSKLDLDHAKNRWVYPLLVKSVKPRRLFRQQLVP